LNDENKDLPVTFTCFVNCENVGMAQYNLVHQFREQGFPDVAFASGTTQALFVGEFLYSDLCTHLATPQFFLSTSKSQIQTITSKIPNLSPSSSRGVKEVIRRDKNIAQTSSSHTFHDYN
jgi:hypothetical protein